MKRAIEVKTVMFALEETQKMKTTPLHQERSPMSFSRVDTSPSERKFKGSKIVRRLTPSKIQRRFSQMGSRDSKSPQKESREDSRAQNKDKKNKSLLRKGICRYDQPAFLEQKMQHSYSNMKLASIKENQAKNDSVLKPTFDQAKTSMNWVQMIEGRKNRIKSQPNNSVNFKQDIIRRVSKKVEFMKKMTLDEETQNPFTAKGQKGGQIPSQLFNFDRLYEHCLKKITKGINCYEKDIGKSKDRKYYELKIQSSILSNELKCMRKSIIKKKDSQESNLGVIGNVIDVCKVEKQRLNTQRGSQSRPNPSYKKKLERITRNMEGRNPFTGGELHGWQIRCDKAQDFYL